MAHVMGNRRSSRLARGTRAAPTWTKLILASVCMLVGVVGALASRDMAFGSSATHGIAATAHKLLAATRGPRRPRTCSIVASATGDVLVRSRKEGADAHWDNLMRGTWGDFHGRFCRWDPGSLELLIETHLLRSYHIHGEGNNAIFRQDNKIFFDDERGTVARGPWDVKKPEHCTEKGFIHPRVGFGQGTTFVMTPPPAQATAWAVHKIAKAEAVLENGIMKLGKGYEGEGYMVEMIVSHGAHIKLSVGYIYDYVSGALKHVTFNREDNRGWPSAFWTHDVRMFAIDADSIDATLGLPSAVTQVLGTGHQIEIPVNEESAPLLQQLKITDVSWSGHLSSLATPDTAVLQLPDGLVMVAPRAIPFGDAWAAALLWRPADASVVHSLETRYHPSGSFDCFRHLAFAV